jgi:hypothetical protein
LGDHYSAAFWKARTKYVNDLKNLVKEHMGEDYVAYGQDGFIAMGKDEEVLESDCRQKGLKAGDYSSPGFCRRPKSLIRGISRTRARSATLLTWSRG